MFIDAHHHLWRYDAAEYPWIQSHWPIRRDFLPADLEPELKTAGVQGTVLVQTRQSLAETQWLLELAQATPFIRGVVGWVDLCSPQAAALDKVFRANAESFYRLTRGSGSLPGAFSG